MNYVQILLGYRNFLADHRLETAVLKIVRFEYHASNCIIIKDHYFTLSSEIFIKNPRAKNDYTPLIIQHPTHFIFRSNCETFYQLQSNFVGTLYMYIIVSSIRCRSVVLIFITHNNDDPHISNIA